MFDENDADCGEVELFVPEREYDEIDVPEPVINKVVTPKSALFGVSDGVLENTIFTCVKLTSRDFISPPKRNISLVFVKKDAVDRNPKIVGCLSPLILVLSGFSTNGDFFVRQSDRCQRMTGSILADHYLVLPLYLTSRTSLGFQGVDVAFRNFHGTESGKLWARAFRCVDIMFGGESYLSPANTPYHFVRGLSLYRLWRYGPVIEELRLRLLLSLRSFDLEQLSTPDFEKYTMGEGQ